MMPVSTAREHRCHFSPPDNHHCSNDVYLTEGEMITKLESGPITNMMAALPNIGGALCSMQQSLADAHY